MPIDIHAPIRVEATNVSVDAPAGMLAHQRQYEHALLTAGKSGPSWDELDDAHKREVITADVAYWLKMNDIVRDFE